ncbi:MAG: tRNA (guanosine(46)-N7)-methyltransferase TrmB [Selenomonadaceae bacterium]|nr:tRNA (guanosine(46)-N7)-methyltransferase TrmB [Selenomonadaceae bacterium]
MEERILRIRRKKNTAEKLQDFSNFVITENIGEEYKGTWRKFFDENNLSRELHVELGTGKGDFITQLAEKNPDKNFLGLEVEREVVLKAARKIQEKNLKNVRLVLFDINQISEIFAENEIDRLYINFCDPWPKKKHAKRRLTHVNFLEMYRKILKPDGEIHFKTDNRGLFDFSLEQFEIAGLKVRDLTFDLHANEPPENIRTEYENKFSSLGTPINRCVVLF